MPFEFGQIVGDEARHVDYLDAHSALVERDGQHADDGSNAGIDMGMEQERRRWCPDMTEPIPHDVVVTVQMAADDDLHRRAAQAAKQAGAGLGIYR